MKKLIEVSLKSIIFFIGWAIFVSVIPIPDIDNTCLLYTSDAADE